jgi:hypothetical protein
MVFPISGVEVSPLVPLAAGFLLAASTTPAGVSGAFLLLPFQFSVLGYTAPGVTATNLLYNVISTPGGILSYRRRDRLDRSLVLTIVTGAVPGVVAGSVLRVTVLADPGGFKVFVGVVLGCLGVNLIVQARHRQGAPCTETLPAGRVRVLAAAAGLIGGIYGISGGSIIAPALAGIFHLPVKRVAPAALVATLITSLVGVASFEILHLVGGSVSGSRPDWALAALFGIGGACGGWTGARFQGRVSEPGLRLLLGSLAVALAASYVVPSL